MLCSFLNLPSGLYIKSCSLRAFPPHLQDDVPVPHSFVQRLCAVSIPRRRKPCLLPGAHSVPQALAGAPSCTCGSRFPPGVRRLSSLPVCTGNYGGSHPPVCVATQVPCSFSCIIGTASTKTQHFLALFYLWLLYFPQNTILEPLTSLCTCTYGHIFMHM